MAACLPFFEAVAYGGAADDPVGLSPSLLLEMEFDFPSRNEGAGHEKICLH